MKRTIGLVTFLFFTNFIGLQLAAHAAQQAAEQTTPESVRKSFPSAQTFTRQHHDLQGADIFAIEKASGTAWAGHKDFHTYFAIGTTNGRRAQLGAATIMENVGGAGDLTIAYDNDLKITKIATSKTGTITTSRGFLNQFIGKGHDDPITLGKDIKYPGSDRVTAIAITLAVKRATHAMQHFYGGTHR